MTAKQLRTALDRLGLSQLGAARLLGNDARTVRRWVEGTRSIPPAVAIIIRLMGSGRLSIEDVEAARSK